MPGRWFRISFEKSICIATVTLLFLCASCGSSNNNAISNAQAQAISQEFVTAAQSAMTSSFIGISVPAGGHASLSKIIREAHPETSSNCTTDPNGQSCNFPISYTGPCQSGGTISVSGDFSLTLDNNGDGSSSDTLILTPTNCVISNLTINGDPSVALATTIDFTNTALDFPLTMKENGGISYGPHPSGSCTMNVSLTIAATSCSVSGTVCGRSVSGNC